MAEEDTNPLHSEQQEEQEQPQGLRGLANEQIRRERSKYNTPIGERDFDSEDRVIDRNDERSLEQVEEPRFRTTEDAYEHLQGRKAEAEEEKFEEQKTYLDENDEQHRTTVRSTATLSTDDERTRHANYLEKYQRLEQAAQRQAALEQRGAAEVARLRAAGQEAAAHIVANQILAGRAPLQQEAAEVQRLGQQWGKYHIDKQRASLQQEVLRTCPGLVDPGTRKAFTRWLESEHRIPLSVIENEWNPMAIGEAYKAYEAHETELYNKVARRDVAKHRLHERGTGSDRSSESARKSLHERGKVDDALNYLALKRREKAVGL